MRGPTELDKSAATIRGMFAEVAPRYDLLNRVLSGRLDVAWRERSAASLTRRGPVLDLCCGTGDQAIAIERRRSHLVVASDFCLPMLALAGRKFERLVRSPHGLAADALALPFASGSFAAVTVSFGLRNFADLDIGLAEIRRVLVPAGEARFLEFALPRAPWLRIPYRLYLTGLLPAIGALLSPNGAAYRYLQESVVAFPQRGELTGRMTGAGFSEATWEDLTGGIVCLYKGVAA